FERRPLGVEKSMCARAALLVEEGGCERCPVRALCGKSRILLAQTAEQSAKRVRRSFGGATRLPPNFGKALFVNFRSRGRVCLSLPGLRHFVLCLQRLRRIECALD